MFLILCGFVVGYPLYLFMNMNDVQLKVLLLFLGIIFFFIKKIKSIRLDRNLSLLFAASCNKHTYTSMK